MIAARSGRTADITKIVLDGKHINLDIQEKVSTHRAMGEANCLWLPPELL